MSSRFSGLAGFSALEAADRRARDELRRSASERRDLLDLIRTSCLAELAKLGQLEELDLAGFAAEAIELLVQFLPIAEAVLAVDLPSGAPLEVRSGRGGVGELSVWQLATGTASLGRLTMVSMGEPIDLTFGAQLAEELSKQLSFVLHRQSGDHIGPLAPAPAAEPEAVPAIDPGAAELELLTHLAGGSPLAAVMESVVNLAIAMVPGAAAVLLADPSGTILRLGGSLGLDRDQAVALDGLAVSGTGGPAGRALWAGRVTCEPCHTPAAWAEDLIAAQLGASTTWAIPAGAGSPSGVVLLWPANDAESGDAAIQLAQRKLGLLTAIVLQRHHEAVELARHTTHDRLTGLANRVEILDRVAGAVARSRRVLSSVAVLVLDIDRFKMVNDTLGHELGDRLLVAMAGRLRRAMRPGDVVGRLGADEFVIVCEDVGGEFQAVDIARHLSEVVGRAFSIAGREVYLTSSIGIAIASGAQAEGDDTTIDAAGLLRDADAAMARAKAAGTNRWELFDQATRERLLERLEIQNGLRRAVDHGELRLVFQPEVELATGRIVGVEALVRWHHPQLGVVPPNAFIPAAEETGLIVPIGAQVLEAACRQAARWEADHGITFPVWVNLSGRQLSQADLSDVVGSALAATGARPGNIGLEITESAVMQDAEAAREHLLTLRALGVGLAIDDFGTGYSSLAYLKRFTVDRLKVDRSFVSGIEDDPDDAGIVAAIVHLARVLGLDVVAEGVELEGQAAALARLGCTLAQGYLFARPEPPEVISALLAAGGHCRMGNLPVPVAASTGLVVPVRGSDIA